MKKWEIGYTSGTFDLLHRGHINILQKAKERCEHLIVAVSTDELCLQYKGILPFQSLAKRMHNIEALKEADQVVIQSSMDKMRAYESYHFDVIFVGDDWKGSLKWKAIEERFAELDVDVVYFPYTPGISSSLLRETIVKFGLRYEKEPNSFCISRYTGTSETELTIPSELCGIPITEILPCAFACHEELQSIVLPDTIEKIGSEAFCGCTALQKIHLPDSIQRIDIGAFAGCTSLKEITLPHRLKVLAPDLFYHCGELSFVRLPQSIEIIRENAFRRAEHLLREKDSVLYFDKWCISCADDTADTINIEEGTIGIADAAFLGHPSLTHISIPSSVAYIGMFAFDGTPLWERPSDTGVIFADYWAVGISEGRGRTIKSIVLPKDTAGIGDLAFADHIELEHVYYQDSKIRIGDRCAPIPPRLLSDNGRK